MDRYVPPSRGLASLSSWSFWSSADGGPEKEEGRELVPSADFDDDEEHDGESERIARSPRESNFAGR